MLVKTQAYFIHKNLRCKMINETILAIIIAFVISAALCPVVIPMLHKLKFGQQVRQEGPQAHLKKQGTPTMGGLIILGSIIVTSLFYLKDYPKIIPVLFVTVGFGIIGFLDDYIKIVMKRSEGLNPKQKLAGQIVITAVFTYYLMNSGDVGTRILIPFTGGFDHGLMLDLGYLYIPFVFVVLLGTDCFGYKRVYDDVQHITVSCHDSADRGYYANRSIGIQAESVDKGVPFKGEGKHAVD